MPIVTRHERSALEFYDFFSEMMIANPRGFRQNGARDPEPSMIEKLAFSAGVLEYDPHQRLPQSEQKRARRQNYLRAMREERRLRELYRAQSGDRFAPVAPRGWVPE